MIGLKGNQSSSRINHHCLPLTGRPLLLKFPTFQSGPVRGGGRLKVARRAALCAMIVASLGFAGAAQALKKSPLQGARKKVGGLIAASNAETVAVAFYDLASGSELLINPDLSFHAASTMKVPVMLALYRQAAAGKLSLEDRLPVKNDFLSIADGSHFSTSAGDDSELSLYKKIGETATVRELMRLMITASSNLATNILIERVTPARVMRLMREI